MLKKVVDIKTKSDWLLKFQLKKSSKKVETFQVFFRQVFVLCFVILRSRVWTAHALRKIMAEFLVCSDFWAEWKTALIKYVWVIQGELLKNMWKLWEEHDVEREKCF